LGERRRSSGRPGAMPSRGEQLRHEFSCWIAAVRTHYLVLLFGTVAIYFPRLVLSYVVFFSAQFTRLLARVLGVAGRGKVANRRILLISDYMPPQTHGIAIRCDAYLKEMRAQGHEVICFSTAMLAERETSFDHPNIPSVVNPFNLKNRIGYNPGVKLAWYLGAMQWDVVHVVFPSLLGCFVLPLCALRRIPVYCSHHVEMSMFAKEHVPIPAVCAFGMFTYNLIGKWPAMLWGTLNSAPTLCFARDHMVGADEALLRRVPSGTHDVFQPKPMSDTERSEVRKNKFKVTDEKTKVVLMVQRLSGEKGTDRIFPAFAPKDDGGEGVQGVLVIAGDGPSKEALMREAAEKNLPVVFLGNVPHHELPSLYRAADCFVTMSLSETFGLTSLEAAMCGCPPVMPYCGVFDEIWGEKVPDTFRYQIDSLPQLASAISTAQSSGRKYLEDHPLNMTWKRAATELLGQYEECIRMNETKKKAVVELVKLLDHCVRVAIGTCIATWLMLKYFRMAKRVGAMFGVSLESFF